MVFRYPIEPYSVHWGSWPPFLSVCTGNHLRNRVMTHLIEFSL